jgi:amidohydrolase
MSSARIVLLLAIGSCLSCGDAAEVPPAAGAARPAGLLADAIDEAADRNQAQVVAWRRDLHEHPELSNREFRTAELVASELQRMGLVVRRKVAHTGVVALLEGSSPEPVVALRADMDALPVTEETRLPFASRVRTEFGGREVGVMHACGHDAHVAILLGVAETLSGLRERLPGSVLFVFQPAEEGAPPGEEGGEERMLADGVFANPRPGAIFGLHVVPQHEAGEIAYRARGAMASSDRLRIVIHGRQTHAAYPWLGVDPITVAARTVLALQALPAREVDTRIPAVVSIGQIQGGVRGNIIPDSVELVGTLRALDPVLRETLHEKVRKTAEGTAATAGARAEVTIEHGYPVTYNDPELVRATLPTLERVAPGRVIETLPRTGAEDFSYFAREVPGFYFWLGIRSPGTRPEDAAPNHSPLFRVDESALPVGVRALSNVAVDWLSAH